MRRSAGGWSVTAAALLLGACTADHPAPAPTSPAPAVAQPTTCQELAAARFLVAITARRDGSGARVTGHPATAACDDDVGVEYDVGTEVVEVRLPAGSTVTVLTVDARGTTARTIAPASLAASLAAWLPADAPGRTFQVTGAYSAATALTEQNRP